MEWKLRHMENTSYWEGKNKVWIWIVHSLWECTLRMHPLRCTSRNGIWISSPSKGKIHSYPPRPASTGQQETVLKQWWSVWNSGPFMSPLCLETSATPSPLLVGPCPNLSLAPKTTHHQTFCPSVSCLPQPALRPPHTSTCFLSMSRLACLKVLTCWQKEPSLI